MIMEAKLCNRSLVLSCCSDPVCPCLPPPPPTLPPHPAAGGGLDQHPRSGSCFTTPGHFLIFPPQCLLSGLSGWVPGIWFLVINRFNALQGLLEWCGLCVAPSHPPCAPLYPLLLSAGCGAPGGTQGPRLTFRVARCQSGC